MNNLKLEASSHSTFSIALLTVLTVFFLGVVNRTQAQWLTNGNNTTTTNKVGIGTTTPTAPLEVVDPDGNNMRLYRTGYSIDWGVNMRFALQNSSQLEVDYAGLHGQIANNTTGSHGGNLIFTTATGGTLTEKMRITSAGNLGVGTLTPAFKFDLQGGQINASGGLCIAGDCKTAWSQVGGGAGSQWTTSGSSIYYNSGNVGIGTTNPNAKLVIPSGNVGLGSNDVENWTGASSVIESLNTSLFFGLSSDIHVLSNAYNSTSWKYKSAGPASNYYLYNGAHGFRVAPSGAADAPLSWAEAMTITNSGNVGIGTTAPNSRLEVQGTSSSRNTLTLIGDGDAGGYAGIKIAALTTTSIASNRTSQFNLHMRKGNWYGGDNSGPSFIIEAVSKVGGYAAPFVITPTNDVLLNGGAGASGLSYGNVGIGTTSPTTTLDVAGLIRSSSGGFKFPDGTLQTTAAVSSGSSGTITAVIAGAGLTGGATSGASTLDIGAGTGVLVAADTISVKYGSLAGTAVQGNTSITISPGTGMSGGGSITLGNAGSLTLTNSDPGSSQSIFKNIANAAGVTQFSAASNSDALRFEGTGGTNVSFDAASKRITISGSATASSGWSDGGANVNLTNTSAKVGIGTTSPLQRLQIGGNTESGTATPDAISLGATYSSVAGANPKLRLFDNNAGSVYGLGVSDSQFDFMVPASGRYVWSVNGIEKMRLDDAGNITVAGNIAAKYQDVAEWVESSQDLLPGMVVVLDHTKSNQVIASSLAYDTRVAGVISAQPGIALGEQGEGKVLVATTGRVRIRVDATRAPIQIGDLLVTGDREGRAIKSQPINIGGVEIHRPGTLIGKALEPLAKGEGEILVLLSLQ